jgi:chromate reductase, NAD(P)H dehydrogenase (quinone)
MSTHESCYRIAVIIGSVRDGNFTSKAASLVIDELEALGVGVDRIDPATLELPSPGTGSSKDAERIQQLVTDATGVVIATPEYHSCFSSVTKLVIENLGFPSKLGGKPIALLGVAAGQIGAIKSLEALRGVCSHVGGIVLPGPVSVAGVQQAFDADGNCLDERTAARIQGLARTLNDYIKGSICPGIALEKMVRS